MYYSYILSKIGLVTCCILLQLAFNTIDAVNFKEIVSNFKKLSLSKSNSTRRSFSHTGTKGDSYREREPDIYNAHYHGDHRHQERDYDNRRPPRGRMSPESTIMLDRNDALAARPLDRGFQSQRYTDKFGKNMMTEEVESGNYDSTGTNSRGTHKSTRTHRRSGSNMVGGRYDMSMSTSTGKTANFYDENNYNRRNSQTNSVSRSDRTNISKYTDESDGSISSDSPMNTRDFRRERHRGYSRERDRQINSSRDQIPKTYNTTNSSGSTQYMVITEPKSSSSALVSRDEHRRAPSVRSRSRGHERGRDRSRDRAQYTSGGDERNSTSDRQSGYGRSSSRSQERIHKGRSRSRRRESPTVSDRERRRSRSASRELCGSRKVDPNEPVVPESVLQAYEIFQNRDELHQTPPLERLRSDSRENENVIYSYQVHTERRRSRTPETRLNYKVTTDKIQGGQTYVIIIFGVKDNDDHVTRPLCKIFTSRAGELSTKDNNERKGIKQLDNGDFIHQDECGLLLDGKPATALIYARRKPSDVRLLRYFDRSSQIKLIGFSDWDKRRKKYVKRINFDHLVKLERKTI